MILEKELYPGPPRHEKSQSHTQDTELSRQNCIFPSLLVPEQQCGEMTTGHYVLAGQLLDTCLEEKAMGQDVTELAFLVTLISPLPPSCHPFLPGRLVRADLFLIRPPCRPGPQPVNFCQPSVHAASPNVLGFLPGVHNPMFIRGHSSVGNIFPNNLLSTPPFGDYSTTYIILAVG